MAWSLVQQSAAQGLGGVATLPAGSAAGNLLAAVVTNGTGTALAAPSGWSTPVSVANSTITEAYIFAYYNNPGALSSFTFTGGSGAIQVVVGEFTCPGVARVGAASATGTQLDGTVSASTVISAATARAGDLVIAGFMERLVSGSAITWTDPAGFTEFSGLSLASSTGHSYGAYELSAGSAGAQSVTGTSSVAGRANGWSGVVATFTQPAPFLFNTQQAVMVAATR